VFHRIITWLFGDEELKTSAIALLTATVGILSGYGLYLLWWEQMEKGESGWTFAWALLAAAVMSLTFEYLRGVIEGSEHPWTFSRVLTTIIMLASFELFIISIHDSAELHLDTFVSVAGYVFGKQFGDFAGPWLNLLALGGLWIWVALIIAFKLREFIIGWPYPRSNPEPGGTLRQYLSHMRPDLWRGARAGLRAGVIWAPLAAVVYVIIVRAYFVASSIHKGEIQPEALLAWGPAHLGTTWPGLLLYGPALLAGWGAEHFGPIGLVIGIVAATAIASLLVSKENRPLAAVWPTIAVVLLLSAPIFSTRESRLDLLYLLLMSAVIWGVPATLLGLLAPLLRRPASHPPVWGMVASAAATVMALVTVARFYSGAGWAEGFVLIGATLLLLVLAFLLFSGAWTEELWSCLALSIGMVVWGTTSLMQSVNLLNMQKRAHSLIGVRLAPTEPPGPLDEALAGRHYADLYLTAGQTQAIPCTADYRNQKNVRIAFNDDDAKCLKQFDRSGKEALAGAQSLSSETSALQISKLNGRIAELEQIEARLQGAQSSFPANVSDFSPPLHWPGQLGPAVDALLADLRLADDSQFNLELNVGIDPTAAQSRIVAQGKLGMDRAFVVRQLSADFATLEYERKTLETRREALQLVQAQHLELTMTSSLGFWVTIGLLAIWRLVYRQAG
jgi:hypothetical protein